jgi:hypothetical protein
MRIDGKHMLNPKRRQRDVLWRAKSGEHAEKSQLALRCGETRGQYGHPLARPLRNGFFAQPTLQVQCQLFNPRRKFWHHTSVITLVRQKRWRNLLQIGHVLQHALGVQHGVQQVGRLVLRSVCKVSRKVGVALSLSGYGICAKP